MRDKRISLGLEELYWFSGGRKLGYAYFDAKIGASAGSFKRILIGKKALSLNLLEKLLKGSGIRVSSFLGFCLAGEVDRSVVGLYLKRLELRDRRGLKMLRQQMRQVVKQAPDVPASQLLQIWSSLPPLELAHLCWRIIRYPHSESWEKGEAWGILSILNKSRGQLAKSAFCLGRNLKHLPVVGIAHGLFFQRVAHLAAANLDLLTAKRLHEIAREEFYSLAALEQVCGSLINSAATVFALGNPTQAIQYLKGANDLCNKKDWKKGIYSSLARAYLDMGEIARAKEAAKKADELEGGYLSNFYLSWIMADIHLVEGNLRLARNMYDGLLARYEGRVEITDLALVGLQEAKISLMIEGEESARESLKRVKDIISTSNESQNQRIFLLEVSRIVKMQELGRAILENLYERYADVWKRGAFPV